MNKTIFSICITVAIGITTFVACKKDFRHDQPANPFSSKITTWLDKQRHSDKPNQSATIASLQEHLDYSRMTTETSINGQQLLVIPIAAKFGEPANINSSSIMTLVVFLDKADAIRNAHIAIYESPQNKHLTNLPENTFSKIFTGSSGVTDGHYRFLGVAGARLFQLEYQKGKLYSQGTITTKSEEGATKSNSVKSNNSTCIDWYLVTTYYYPDGTTRTTSEYVGRTCSGCDNGVDQVPCRGNGEESGGGEEQISIETDASMEQGATSDTEESGAPDGEVSQNRYYPPVYLNGHARLYGTYVLGTGEKFISAVTVFNATYRPVVSQFTDSWGIGGVRTISATYNQNTWTPLVPRSSCYIRWYTVLQSSFVSEDGIRSWITPWSNNMASVFWLQ